MRSYYDDYDDFDDRSLEDYLTTRRDPRDKPRRKAKKRGRRHPETFQDDGWNAFDWESGVDYDDYDDSEFDSYYDDFAVSFRR